MKFSPSKEIIEHISNIYWIYDYQNEELVYINKAIERVLDLKKQEVLGKFDKWKDYIYKQDYSIIGQFCKSTSTRAEYFIRVKNKSENIYLFEIKLHYEKQDEKVVAIHGIMEKVTDVENYADDVKKTDNSTSLSKENGKKIIWRKEKLNRAISILQKAILDKEKNYAFFKNIFDHTDTGICIVNYEGIIQHVNKAMSFLLGYKINDLTSKPLIDIFEEEKRYGVMMDLKKMVKTGQPISKRLDLKSKDGKQLIVLIQSNLIPSQNYIIFFISNLTESYQNLLKFRESENRFEAIFNNTLHLITLLDDEGRVIKTNHSANRYFKYNPEEIIGLPFWDLHFTYSQENQTKVKEKVLKALTGKTIRYERIFKNTNNRMSALDISYQPVKDKNKQVNMIIVEGRDITHRKLIEESLREQQQILSQSETLTDAGTAALNLENGKITWSNGMFYLLGMEPGSNELTPENFATMIFAEDRQQFTKSWNELIKNSTQTISLPEFRISDKRGLIKIIKAKASRLENSSRKLILTFLDITAQKHREEAINALNKKLIKGIENKTQQLNISEEKYKLISANSFDLITLHNSDGCFDYISPSVFRILGYTEDELFKMNPFHLIYKEDVEKTYKDVAQKVKNETEFHFNDYRCCRKDGSVIWLESAGKVIKNNEGEVINYLVTSRDISLRKEAEFKIRDREELYRLISENMTDIVALHNENMKFTFISPSVTDNLGYKPVELKEKRLFDIVHKKDLKELIQQINHFKQKNLKEAAFRYRIQHKNGHYIWVESLMKLFIDKNGKISGAQSSTRNINQQKKAENNIQAALRKEKELSDLKTGFVSMASHQFRTPLTTIQSSLELLSMYTDNVESEVKEKLVKHFIRIMNEIKRLNDLLDNILIVGKLDAEKTPFRPEKTDLVAFCQTIIQHSYQLTSDNQAIDLKFTGEPVPVSIDPQLMSHVLNNLIANAFKYSSKNVELILIYKTQKVIIQVRDRGIGIPDKDKHRIFENFFRASNVENIKGTGLGLAITKQFIEMHKGTISFTSEEDIGTEFTITLPFNHPKTTMHEK